MSADEGQSFDRKSLRLVVAGTADFDALARDCVCFANGAGGEIHLGIEDKETEPPPGQKLPPGLLDRIRKRVGEVTVNVTVLPTVHVATNGAEYIVLTIPRAVGVASTSDGRYFLRVGDTCRPVVGDEVLRLADERPSRPWESMTSLELPINAADAGKVARLLAGLRASDRVHTSVKEKSDQELLEHYALVSRGVLTNLGVLLLGAAHDRARLGTAPVIQALRYDERGERIGKHVWDDYALSPVELLDAVWTQVPDFREHYEIPEGMFRTSVPAFEEAVIRELLVNALVHRPYTQRGDIFLNLRPESLEIVNPGRLPLGVTPRNILHTTRRRNEGLARVFHDLKLMEREGSGFDLVYERLLANGKVAPVAAEGIDSVHITIPRRVLHPGVIRLLVNVDQRWQLNQRERIALALLAQTEGLLATELAERLELPSPDALKPWIGRLLEQELVSQSGRTRATRYYVPPELLREAGLDGRTTLKRLEPHRLRALVREDLSRYPDSSRPAIQRRIGPEIGDRSVMRALEALIASGEVTATGERRWRTYRLAAPHGQRA